MKKKAQVYLLDTEQIKEGSIVSLNENTYQRNHKGGYTNDIIQNKGELSIARDIKNKFYGHGFTPKYLYFTSDEEIKKGNWVIHPKYKSLYQWIENADIKFDRIDAKKVIATTNPELFKDTKFNMDMAKNSWFNAIHRAESPILIPKIGDDFVEAYIKAYNEGKPITEVNLEYEEKVRHTSRLVTDRLEELKLRSNGTVIISPVVEKMYTRDEVYKMFTTLSYEMAQQIIGNRPELNGIPIVPHEWFEETYPE